MIDGETKKQLLEELRKSGNIYRSCLKVGINRSTIYRWKEADGEFNKQMEEAERIGRSNNCDIAEHFLMDNIRKGNITAIKYYLSHNSAIYQRPLPPNIQIFENAFPGEGLSRYRIAKDLRRRFEEKGGVPLKPGGEEVSDIEMEKYKEYINKWYEDLDSQ